MWKLAFLLVVLAIFGATTAMTEFTVEHLSTRIECQPIGSSTSVTISFIVMSKEDPPPNITDVELSFDFGEASFTVAVPDSEAPVLTRVFSNTKEYIYKKPGIYKTKFGNKKMLIGGSPSGGITTIADMLMEKDNCVYDYVAPTGAPSQAPTTAPSAATSSRMTLWFPILLASFMMICALI